MASDPLPRASNDASRDRLRSTIDGLDDDALATELPGGWTVSAVLAHLAYWDRVAERRWSDLLTSGRRPVHVDDAVNDELLPKWRATSAREAARGALAAADAVDRLIASAPADLREEMARDWPRQVDRSLHRNEHLDEIARAMR